MFKIITLDPEWCFWNLKDQRLLSAGTGSIAENHRRNASALRSSLILLAISRQIPS
jgi:hypothetical protein